MHQQVRTPTSPWFSLIILLGLTLACSFVMQFMVIGIDWLVYGPAEGLATANGSLNVYTDRALSLYALLASGTLGAFLLPSLILQYIERHHVYLHQQFQRKEVYLLAVVFLFAFGPSMQLLSELNAQLALPDSMQALESWMKGQEDNMASLTERVIMVDSIPLLLLNIIVMALLPAIAEEFYFRGSILHIAKRMVHNDHIAIWLTAIIFSAIHLQFYGFLPRLFLGAMFGYMYIWTRNIWVPVLGHFVNNATVTILAYYYASQGRTYEELQRYENYSIFVYLGSFILAVGIAYGFYTLTHKQRKLNGERLDQNMDIR